MNNTTSFESIVDAVLPETIVDAVSQNNVEAVKQFLLSGERLTTRCFHAYQSVEMLQLFETQHIDLQQLDLVQLLLPQALYLWRQNILENETLPQSCLYYLCAKNLHLLQKEKQQQQLQLQQQSPKNSEHHLRLKHLIEQELKLQKMELSEQEWNILLN